MGVRTLVLIGWCVFVGQVASTKPTNLNDGQRFHVQLIKLADDVMGLQEMQVSSLLERLVQ